MEEIKNLLDKIQKEAVWKAEEEKKKILSDAKEKASKIVNDAKQEAEEILKKAKIESELSSRRSIEAIKQAARDIVISLQNELTERLRKIMMQNISETMTPEFMKEIIVEIVKSGKNTDDLKIILPEKKLKELEAQLLKLLSKDLKNNPVILADSEFNSGFKISFKGEDVLLDFSSEAFTDIICAYAGPRIAAILKEKEIK
ncbi:MAG TPA: hypothetical protein P5270_04595 [Victivallales bacterium]|nr:hypothetical protein [Victivallales bacterium]HPO90618.1 hypothetical protein [Victivallales bacterium]HRR28620.1 hypothetical protein [Victivallales bacterium]HRU00766.1 hypothetical protein [Victivallales bacterium]